MEGSYATYGLPAMKYSIRIDLEFEAVDDPKAREELDDMLHRLGTDRKLLNDMGAKLKLQKILSGKPPKGVQID